MPLDLSLLSPQIDEMAASLAKGRGDFRQRLESALAAAQQHSAGPELARLQDKLEAHRNQYVWQAPSLREPLSAVYSPPPLPQEFAVVAVDGSQIELDRDSPLPCYLLNTGRVLLRYGPQPSAHLESVPRLFFRDEEMVLRDRRRPLQEQRVDGAVLAVLRAIAEMEALAEAIAQSPPQVPTLALLDGTLVLWGLAGGSYPDFVGQRLLQEYIQALDKLRALVAERPLAVASYISFPQAIEVIGALRVALCPYPEPDCRRYCGTALPLERPCDAVARVRDRDVFEALLRPGERSGLFESQSLVVRSTYAPAGHAVLFFYLRGEREVARVEAPVWSADSERLGILHSILSDQIALGDGYPLALAEAHERAVVTAADREVFWQMVEGAAEGSRVVSPGSAKRQAKRRRGL